MGQAGQVDLASGESGGPTSARRLLRGRKAQPLGQGKTGSN